MNGVCLSGMSDPTMHTLDARSTRLQRTSPSSSPCPAPSPRVTISQTSPSTLTQPPNTNNPVCDEICAAAVGGFFQLSLKAVVEFWQGYVKADPPIELADPDKKKKKLVGKAKKTAPPTNIRTVSTHLLYTRC